MGRRLGVAGRWLWEQLVEGLMLVGLAFFPGTAILVQQARRQGAAEPAPAGADERSPGPRHPERMVPYADLSEEERRFWSQLADRVEAP